MGFDPVLEAGEAAVVEELPRAARREQAVAAVRLELLENGVRVWLFDRATGKTLARELTPSTKSEEANLALHVVELLRASLLELELPDAPRGDLPATPELLEVTRVPAAAPRAPQPVDASPALAPEASKSGARLELELGAALVKGSGDLELYPAVLAAARYFVSSELGVGAVGWIPLTDAGHAATVGSSENRITLFGVEVRWQPATGTWRPNASVGFSAAHLRTQGAARTDAYQGESDRALTPGALLRVGLGVRLSRRLQLTPQATAGVQWRYFAIDYADSAPARWGPWWGAVSLTMAADFWE
jgi:hypothetical protein